MRPVLSAEAMRRADARTIEQFGLPGFTLMESAGRAAALHIDRKYGPVSGKTVVCLCGKGNNGGDGFVIARYLSQFGAAVHVMLTAPPDQLSSDAYTHFDLLSRLSQVEQQAPLTTSWEPMASSWIEADIYVDALLGTGLTSQLREPVLSLVKRLNTRPRTVISIDLPTGLHTDDGVPLGDAVRARSTVTMGALKPGLLLADGPTYAGTVEVADIGFPRYILEEESRSSVSAQLLDRSDVKRELPVRDHTAHKYAVGQTLVIAGSQGLTGAAVMASHAAARIGSAAVVCASPAEVRNEIAQKFTAVMTIGLEENASSWENQLASTLGKTKAVLIGPGLGRAAATQEAVRDFLASNSLPTIIDADGLRALAGHTNLIKEHSQGNWILTPHAGEYEALTGSKPKGSARIKHVRDTAKAWGCTILLKGLPSLVASPEGTVTLSESRNPALATAGSGDVLAGSCAGLLAQQVPLNMAAPLALYLGGLAADHYAKQAHPNTMMATDLLDLLPVALHQVDAPLVD